MTLFVFQAFEALIDHLPDQPISSQLLALINRDQCPTLRALFNPFEGYPPKGLPSAVCNIKLFGDGAAKWDSTLKQVEFSIYHHPNQSPRHVMDRYLERVLP